MKLPILLTTLLLSASPVVANEFVYMVCKINANDSRTNLASGDVQSNDTEDFLMFKVDLSKKLFRNHRIPEWSRFRVNGTTIIQDTKINREGFSAHVRGVLPLNPPGPISIDNWFKNTTEHQVIQGEGDCRKTNSSTWEKLAVD